MPHKHILQIFSVCTVIAAILRFAQLFFTIDGATGFSVPGSYEKVNIIVYALLVLIIAIPTFFSAVSSNRQPTRAPIPKSFPLLTVANFLIAVCMLATAGYKFLILETYSLLGLLELCLLLVSAIWFILYASAGFVKIKLPVAFSIAPVLLYLFKLISIFISHNGLANISENIILTLFLCSMLYFFLLQSKILCKVVIRKSSRHIFPVAVLTFMLMVISNIPTLLITLIGKSDILHTSSVVNLEYIVVGAYALIFTLQLYSKNKWPASHYQHSTEHMETNEPNPNNTFVMEHKEEEKQ